jgi:hypothetical protein
MFRPYLPWLIVLAVTAGTGAVAGTLGNRWGTPPDMQTAAGRLARLPAEFGDWQLVDETPLEEHVVRILQCVASTNRAYRNQVSGETVHISLTLGPPGPTSVHSPEVCFSSQGFHVEFPAKRRSFSIRPTQNTETGSDHLDKQPVAAFQQDAFWKTTFVPDRRESTRLIVYYGWCDGRGWLAPDYPRFAFGGLPYLYKVQLATKVATHVQQDVDPCDDFVRALLPALSQSGFYVE